MPYRDQALCKVGTELDRLRKEGRVFLYAVWELLKKVPQDLVQDHKGQGFHLINQIIPFLEPCCAKEALLGAIASWYRYDDTKNLC